MIAAAASTEPSSAGIIAFWVVAVAAYWAPTVVAICRRVPNLAQIIAVNFFAFTVIGWVVALVWALKPRPAAA